MKKMLAFYFVLALMQGLPFQGGASKTSPNPSTNPSTNPLGESKLLALVAGGAVSEDVAHDIAIAGLSFHPDDSYRSQLKEAGADAKVLAAVEAAKVVVSSTPLQKADKVTL